MDAPEELVDAVAEVLWNGDSTPFVSWAHLAVPVKELQRDAARRVLAVPGIADALADATRLRSLAATFGGHLNRGKTFLGAEVAAMLRDGGA